MVDRQMHSRGDARLRKARWQGALGVALLLAAGPLWTYMPAEPGIIYREGTFAAYLVGVVLVAISSDRRDQGRSRRHMWIGIAAAVLGAAYIYAWIVSVH